MSRNRNWCLTLNNYSENDIIILKNNNKISYGILGKEVGKENNIPHIQGYLEFNCPMGLAGLKKIHDKIHWEERKGTQEQAINYCKKDNNFEEFGIKKVAGKRTDLMNIKEIAKNGMRSVTNEIANFQAIRIAEKWLEYNEIKRDYKPKILWFYGKTGCGKSKKAHEIFENEDYYRKADGSKWWPGYDNQENIIIDDFRDSWWPITYMLNLCDRYECRIETKGGYRQFKGRFIIITCAFHPNECYKGTGECIEQLIRRLDEIIKMDKCTEVEGNTDSPLCEILADLNN